MKTTTADEQQPIGGSSPIKMQWQAVYMDQAKELVSFPTSEEKFNEYLETIEKTLKHKTSRYPDYAINARIAALLVADAKLLESIPYFEMAVPDLRLARTELEWDLMFQMTALQYANTLDSLGDLVKAEEIYQELVEIDPKGEQVIEYALFLHRRKKDMVLAEKYYEIAVQQFPRHASVSLKYAGFLRHVKRDIEKAEQFYRRSMDINPNYGDAIGGYASFLYGMRRNMEMVEGLYERAMQLDEYNISNLCNYGLFLSEEQRNFIKAEEIYRRALKISASHSNTLYNYAVMLDTHLQRKEEAESLYRKAIIVQPNHG